MTIAAGTREFLDVPLALIDDPELPSRSAMDDAKLDALTESIRAIGLQQPLVLARVGDRFEVIAGHRRRIASARAGLSSVPAIVYPTKDVDTTVIQAHENSRREELNPADEAIWFSELLDRKCGGDIERLCALVGEKLSYVNNRLLLFHGDPDVFAALQRGDIKIGVAHELNTCPDAHYRRYYLDCAIKSGATITTVTGWITEFKQTMLAAPQGTAAPVADAPGVPDAIHNPFTCEVCGRADQVHLIRQINVHQHCKMAILDPLLAHARGES